MEKIFKYILAILVVCTLVGIFVALNNPRPKLTFNDKIRLSKIIAECNMDLPRRTRQTLWRAVQMLTQKLCCQTIHDCPKVVPLHYESE